MSEQTTNENEYDVSDSDCHYFIEIVGAAEFESLDYPGGELYYECDVIQTELSGCDDDWEIVDDNTDSTLIEGSGSVTNQQLSNNTYTFLAPLPGLREVTGNEGVAKFLKNFYYYDFSCRSPCCTFLIFAGFQYITTGVSL